MIVHLFKRRFAITVLLIAGTTAVCYASESTPAQWKQAFPLSTLHSTTDGVLPEEPDLLRSLSYRETGATAAQIDPVSKTATIRFGPHVTTIGEATKMILDPVGYELLAAGPNVSSLLEELLESPLPVNQREFKHLRVSEMLRALAGVGHVVVFDHVHRKTTFDPVPRYTRIGQVSRADVSARQRAGHRLLQRLRPNTIVPPLGQSTRQTQRGSIAESRFDAWQTVDDAGVSDRKLSQLLAATRATTVTEQYLVRAPLDATRLLVDAEVKLRHVASEFSADKHTVVIRDCSGDVPVQVRQRHHTLISSELVRLGVDKQHHQSLACAESDSPVITNGLVTHVVSLSANAL